MGVAGIGYTGYTSNMPLAGRTGSGSPQQAGMLPLFGPQNRPLQAAAGQQQANPVFINGTNPLALFRSMDGDSVELSGPVRQPLSPEQYLPSQPPLGSPSPLSFPSQQMPPAQQQLPSQPVLTIGINNEPDTLIPEMPGSGLLDSLKPEGECQTCANRKYVDGSDDPSVSYQTPTKISPGMAGAAVAAHEQEHVRNEQADAQREGREVVSQTVTLHYDCCPECGKSYVSGGTTRTMTVGKKDNSPIPEAEPQANAQGAKSGGDENS